MFTQDNLTVNQASGFFGWHAFSENWKNANLASKALMIGGIVVGLSAAAVGVALALAHGVPPDTVMHGLHYAYEAMLFTKHIVDYGAHAWKTLSTWFAAQPIPVSDPEKVRSDKTEQGCNFVLPLMKALQMRTESQPVYTAAAA